MINVKYTIEFETDEKLTEDEETELMNYVGRFGYVSQFSDEISLDED